VHLVGFILRIYHDAQSHERQIMSVGRLGSAGGRLPFQPELILASFAVFRIVEQPGFNGNVLCVLFSRLGHKIFLLLCSHVTNELCYWTSHKIQNIVTVVAWFGIWQLRVRYFGIRRCVLRGLRASRRFKSITSFPKAGKSTKIHGVANMQDLNRQYQLWEEL